MTKIEPIAAAPGAALAPARIVDLKQTARDFESMFVGQLLRAMPTAGGGLKARESGPYGDFLIDEYAKLVTRRGGLGIADAIYRELSSSPGGGT